VLVLVVTYFVVRPYVFPEEGRISVQITPENGSVSIDDSQVKTPYVSLLSRRGNGEWP